ncbi:hypothetical protein VTL71DRAFT_2059 [Oculimacula yallundae]|uniref:Protein kinase domain-containing protein n=1 Tax=Oculimacula yallundae TaxID=86028 RepID=A0ABR4C7T3_9HELO
MSSNGAVGGEPLEDPEAISLLSLQPVSTSDVSTEEDYDLISISTLQSRRHRSIISRATASRDQFSGPQTLLPDESERSGRVLLSIFRILQSRKVKSLTLPLETRFNTRRVLGSGASFAVEESYLPIDTARYLQFYRLLDLGPPDKKLHFVDHTGTKWASDTQVAYKTYSVRKGDFDVGFESRRLDDIRTELQVLCHSPLQKHPNIVRLLGVAWVPDESPESTDNITEASPYQHPLEWPTVVTERAIHGSLRDFLRSDRYKQSEASLKAKWNLCLDVLYGIEALHSCGILHGDVKTANVLIFPSTVSTAENWTAKLSDFGSSLLLDDKVDPDGRMRDEYRGTNYFQPPELDHAATRQLQPELARKTDIWCWGLLVWAVLVDGFGGYYVDVDGNPLRDTVMRNMRLQDKLGDVAFLAVDKKLMEQHPGDHDLRTWILTTLQSTLRRDPRRRPSADRILESMDEFESARGRFYLGSHTIYQLYLALILCSYRPTSDRFDSTAVGSLDDLEFFDLNLHYYNTINFPSIPPRIFRELSDIVAVKSRFGSRMDVLEARFQLAFCHAVGYGTEKDTDLAMESFEFAANKGLPKAMELSIRFPKSIGSEVLNLEVISARLQSSMLDGSLYASKDLCLNFPEEYKTTREKVISRSRQPINLLLKAWGRQSLNTAADAGKTDASDASDATSHLDTIRRDMIVEVIKADTLGVLEADTKSKDAYKMFLNILAGDNGAEFPPLLAAVKAGDFEVVELFIHHKAYVNQTGPNGETALHWLSTQFSEDALKVAALLLDAGLDLKQRTNHVCPLSNDGFAAIEMAPVSTAVEWAVSLDNVELLKVFERHLGAISRNTHFAWLPYAAEYHSYECMKYMCEILPNEYINAFDVRGFSALFYAIRPDEIVQLRRYSSRPHVAFSASICRKDIISLLLTAGSNMRVRVDDSFSPFHLLACIDDPETLQLLLTGTDAKRWMHAPSKFPDQATPLKQAVMKGNLETVKLLLQNGASPSRCEYVLHQNSRGRHALHLCCYTPRHIAVSQAEVIIAADPSAITSGALNYHVTALHTAAFSGHKEMIKFLLRSGSHLTKGSVYLTPLGAAITSRSLTGVRTLCQEHKRAKIPLTAGYTRIWASLPRIRYGRMRVPWTHTHIPAITYLLRPGDSSQTSHMGQLSFPGSYDHPFSKTSENILKILLEYTEDVSFWQDPYSLIKAPERDFASGLPSAVRIANIKVFETIFNTGKFAPDFHRLQLIALWQLSIRNLHLAPEVERMHMLEKLADLDETQYQDRKNARLSLRNLFMRYYYMIKYHWEIDPERRLQLRTREGILKDFQASTDLRLYNEWLPRYKYFTSYVTPSLWWITVCVLWVGFLLPSVLCLIVYSFDNASTWNHHKTVKLVVVGLLVGLRSPIQGMSLIRVETNLNSPQTFIIPFWGKVFRLVSVHSTNRAKVHPGVFPLMHVLQMLTAIVFAAVVVYDIWLLYPGNSHFTPYTGFVGAPSRHELAPRARSAIIHGQRFLNGLIAWIVVTQLTFQLTAGALASFNLYGTISGRVIRFNGMSWTPDQQQTLQAGGKIIIE